MDSDYSLYHIPLYNQFGLSDDLSSRLFISNDNLLNDILSNIGRNQLIVGSMGMGKSSLLKRIEVELRENEEYSSMYIPVLFPSEHYYDIKSNNDIWERDISEKSVVLLLDNLEMFKKNSLKTDFQNFLLKITSRVKTYLIATSSVPNVLSKEFSHLFDVKYLCKPTFEEFARIMLNLADITRNYNIASDIKANISYIKTLYILSDANPRSAAILFKSIVKGFPEDIFFLLNNLLDELSPCFSAIFESLPNQMQIILDMIGLHWAPITIEELRDITGYENQQLSPQLKRLVDMHIIERVDAYKAKGKAYQFCDRLCNLWLIVNSRDKYQRDRVIYLSRFLENFYKDMIPDSVKESLEIETTSLNHITDQIAFVKSMKVHNRLRKEDKGGYFPADLNNYWLQKAIKQISENNFGTADENLSTALADLSGSFQTYEKEDWWRFSKMVIGGGHAKWLLEILKKNNIDSTMSPYYVAVESFTSDNPDKYFNSVPLEMREAAKELREIIGY